MIERRLKAQRRLSMKTYGGAGKVNDNIEDEIRMLYKNDWSDLKSYITAGCSSPKGTIMTNDLASRLTKVMRKGISKVVS